MRDSQFLQTCNPEQTADGRPNYPGSKLDRLAPPVNWKFDLELLAQLNFNDKLVDAGGSAPAFKLSIFLQKTELEHGKNGNSWLFSMLYGAAKHFKRAKPGHQEHSPKFMIIPTFRAGESDLGRRVPSVNSLREKTVAIIGLGAIGAPIALDMARNGCRKLILLDHDVVEPGNSIRWPLGASAWGRHKAAALKDHIELEYPWTSVQPVLHFIGGTPAIIDNNPRHCPATPMFCQPSSPKPTSSSTPLRRAAPPDCCPATAKTQKR